MSVGLEVGQSWNLLWGPEPDQPYAALECSPDRGARWARGQRSAGQSRARRQWATAVGRARLGRELTLVAGDQVAVPPLWVLRAWVDAHFVCCEQPWAACLNAIVARAEAEGRAVRIIDLPELAHAGPAVRWALPLVRPAVLAARPWAREERVLWHEAGHALFAWHHQGRYEPLVVDLNAHLGGLDEGALCMSPVVVPTRTTDGRGRWSPAQTRGYHLWLSGGMAAEQVFVPGLVPLGDASPYGRQYAAQCNVIHLDEAMAVVREHGDQVAALAGYLRAHGGASRRHLTRLLGPRQTLSQALLPPGPPS